mmetsp:Transcript_27314/g.65867  ORF Transcript_27314/g.65867 Transcript_27314/m.65867 type:complete len:505 (-) Transcript_27314:26-1540(-)
MSSHLVRCGVVLVLLMLWVGSSVQLQGGMRHPAWELRLRGGGGAGAAGGGDGSNKRFRYERAFGAKRKEPSASKGGGSVEAETEGEGKEGTGTAKMPSKADLYQLTAQLFNPSGSKKQNYFKILGIDKTATTKQVRDAYYREARKWHPDKNKHDPNAEVRFKLISEAYEVLSNPAKRKAYEEGGREGLDAHEAAENIDIKNIVRALFGGGEFDEIMGDAGEIPLLRRMVEKEAEVRDGTDVEDKEEDDETRKAREEKERELEDQMEKDEEEMCFEVGRKLLARLEGRALGQVNDKVFATQCCEWADSLCRAPGGLDLVRMTSKAWRQKAKIYARRMWGLEGIWTRFQDLAGKISQGTSLIKGALTASRLTRNAMQKGERAKNATNVSVDGGMEEGASSQSDDDDDEDAMEGIDKEEMLKIAKVSLDVIWRFGLFLLQGRVRSSVDAMFTVFRNSSHYSKESEPQLALALLEISKHFRDRYDAAVAANSTEMRTGVPIHLDEMEE